MSAPNGRAPNSLRFFFVTGANAAAGGSSSRCGVSRPESTCISSVGDMRVIAVVRSELCGSDTASGVAGELAVDVGVGIDGDGAYLAVALVHSVAEDAQRNVVLLPRRLAADLSLHLDAELSDAAEIRAEGRVLLAELRGLNPRDWVNVALDGSLLLHSGP